jgi:hypothetical protein
MLEENQDATVEVEKEEAAPFEKTMDDTIRETLRNLKERNVGTDSVETLASPETPEEKAQSIRDEQGKFKDKTPKQEEAPAVEIRAPNTWKKEAAEKFALADPIIRAEVERREADFYKGIEQYKQAAQFAHTMERAIAPHMETLKTLGLSPDKAISELMNADHKLRYGSPNEKNMYFAQLAQSYGIDLGQVQSAPPIDPHLNALQQQVHQLQGHIQHQQLMGKQQEEASLNSEISAFAADPKHSHFDTVRDYMAILLQEGKAKDLPSAYEQAIWANPTTRAAVLAEQQAAAKVEAAKKAQAAKTAASVNVRSRPSMPVSQPIGTMDDTIRATLRRLQSA